MACRELLGGRSLQVGGGDVVPRDEGGLLVDNLVGTETRVEVGLDGLEDGDRAVSTSTAAERNLW